MEPMAAVVDWPKALANCRLSKSFRMHAPKCPLSGVKRTWALALHMSAFPALDLRVDRMGAAERDAERDTQQQQAPTAAHDIPPGSPTICRAASVK
jgi:hypothetical protein